MKRLLDLPWWAYLLLAIFCYSFLNYGLSAIIQPGSTYHKYLDMAAQAAPILAVVFLILAANALYKDDPQESPDEADPTD